MCIAPKRLHMDDVFDAHRCSYKKLEMAINNACGF